MNELELTKKLISLPSFVDGENNEKRALDFVFSYLNENLGSKYRVKKQLVENNRYNIIMSKGKKVDLLVAGHIDTVAPRAGWNTDQFSGIEIGKNLYGLGASDMKGSLACFIKALEESEAINNFMLLIYVDEEYEFKGMKKFITEYGRIRPKVVWSIDGGGPQIGYACRGCIEIEFKVRGKTGHAANPKNGLNAIKISTKAIFELERSLVKYCSKNLGKSTLNVAYIKGGLEKEQINGEAVLGKNGNNISDYCEFVIEIRTATGELDSNKVCNIMTESLKRFGATSITVKVILDVGYWETDKEVLKVLRKFGVKGFKDPSTRGYIDTQMIWKQMGQPICFDLGAGEGGNAHAPNEWISVDGIKKSKDMFRKILAARGWELMA